MEKVAKEKMSDEWYELLKDEFQRPYMIDLQSFIESQKKVHTIYPPENEIFNAYVNDIDSIKVCIVGQDPFINENEAHGLAFSTWGNTYTPSLRQIEKAVRREIHYDNPRYLWYNNLKHWSDQGIMLLNRVLTVNAGRSNSHKGKGWEEFTAKTIQELDKKGIIFLLWGKDAQQSKQYITNPNSIVIMCEHPVAASYQGRTWNNNDCFKKVNEILINKINW